MSNLKIVSDNAVLRATLAASSTAGTNVASNLQITDDKSAVWRATGKNAMLTAQWTSLETFDAVAMLGNPSPTATIRIRTTAEPQATNLLTAPNDFTNAAWTKTNATVTSGVAGPDGANSATTLTATAANGELKQTRTVAAGSNVSSIYIRRRAGAGPVYIRNAANTAWIQPGGLSGTWTRFINDGGTTGTSASVDIMLGTSGDAVDIAFAQLEAGAVASSYYPGTRPLGYIDNWQSFNYSYDSGVVLACPAKAVSLRGWAPAQAANAYAYGGGAYLRLWLATPLQAYGVAITIDDPNNLQTAIEGACLYIGKSWTPSNNASWGASMTPTDTGKNYRTAASDLKTDNGIRSRSLTFTLADMDDNDREAAIDILRGNGVAYPMLVSLFPGDANLARERDHMLIGKLSSISAMTMPYWGSTSTPITIEQV